MTTPNMDKHTPVKYGVVYDGSRDFTVGLLPDPQSQPICNVWHNDIETGHEMAEEVCHALNNYAGFQRENERLRDLVKDMFEYVDGAYEAKGPTLKLLLHRDSSALAETSGDK